MKKYISVSLLTLISLFSLNVLAQNQDYIDSLKQILSTEKEDLKIYDTYLDLGDHFEYVNSDSALSYYQKALKVSEKIDDKVGIKISYGRIGGVYYSLSEYSKAKDYYSKALDIAKEINDEKAISIYYGNIGNVYLDQANYPKALSYYQKALKIAEKIEDKEGIASYLSSLGIVYSNQSNYLKALEYYQKALEINTEIDNKGGISINLGNIANIYAYNSNYEEALKYYFKSLAISENQADKEDMAIDLGNIGLTYSDLKNHTKALEYYQKALKINREIKNRHGEATDLINIGGLYNQINQYNSAVDYLEQALLIVKDIGSLDLEQDTYESLSKAYEGLNNFEKALEFKELSVQINDSVFNTEKAQVLAEMNTKYETEKKENQILQQQAELKTSHLQTEKEKAEKEKQQTQRNMFIIAFGLMIVLAVFVFRSYKQKKKANILLSKQKDIIEEIHHEISESINYATRLQGAILPEEKILEEHLSDHFVFFNPKDKVSGDFYWWCHLENHTVITASDCTGHGVPGAFMSMLGISFLKEIVQKSKITDTGLILEKLRKEIIKTLKQTGESGTHKDGMDMAIISINHENKVVQFSGANNSMYLLTNRELPNLTSLEGFENFYEIKPDKMPIAIYENMGSFNTHEIQLETGDQLYMFSDGYADQFGGPHGKKLKYKPFKRLLYKNRNEPMVKQKELIDNAFRHWKGDFEQIDDVVVLGVKL